MPSAAVTATSTGVSLLLLLLLSALEPTTAIGRLLLVDDCYHRYDYHAHHNCRSHPRARLRQRQSRRCRGRNGHRHSRPLAFTQPELWALRVASASLTYASFIGVADRPRGALSQDVAPYLDIRDSMVPGAGLGLFCKGSILRKGAVLGTYPGVVIPLQQNLDKLRAHPHCEGYIWRFSDNAFVIDPTDSQGLLREACRGGNPSLPLSNALFATLFSFLEVSTALCRINEPPKGRDVNVITEEDLKARTVTFVLERDVYENEELYIDYGLSYDRSRYSGGTEEP